MSRDRFESMPDQRGTYSTDEMQQRVEHCPECGVEMSVDWVPTRVGAEQRWLPGRTHCPNPRCTTT